MNQPTEYPIARGPDLDAESGSADETLRLIARLPAPEGLEDRMHARLHSRPRTARILAWPAAPNLASGWMRTAAAAAIAFVVAGGGWGIYSRVQQPQTVNPPRVATGSGFSSAGAMRTPETLKGPMLAHPSAAQPAPAKATARKKIRRLQSGAANKVSLPAAAPAAK